jgi:hypothetical protein
VERTEEAVKAAEKHGFKAGKRERAQLADVYKERAAFMGREAVRWRHQAQEEDYLRKAEEDYNRAEEYYRSIDPFNDSAASIRIIQLRLEKIYERSEELRSR